MHPAERVSGLISYPVDKYGETSHSLNKLDLKGLICFPSLINEDKRGGYSRIMKCEQLRAERAARRLMAEIGMGPERVGGGADCTGRRFCNYAELIHCDTVYQYAIVKVSYSIDC